MRFAASLSTHPVTAHAIGEAVGQVIEQIGRHPDLAVLFVTRPHAGALEDVADTVNRLLGPTVLIGCAAESVVGNQREVEHEPAVTLWAALTGPVIPVRLWAERRGTSRSGPDPLGAHPLASDPSGTHPPGSHPPGAHPLASDPSGADPLGAHPMASELRIAGWPDDVPFDPQSLLLVGDPFSFPVDTLLKDLGQRHPGLPVLGGMASAARGPGGNRLALGSRIFTDGAVGALLGPGVAMTSVVSQGCRPIGRPLAVTKAERNIIYELAGQPALHRLIQVAKEGGSERDIKLINEGLQIGLVIDEHKADFGRGDFLIRNVVGADRANGAIAIGDVVEVGTTVQFHVRDAEAADEDLRELLAGERADGVLLFTCNGRGSRLFDSADHDAGVVGDLLGEPATAGFFAAGELGPVGGRNFVHGFTASMALFHDASTAMAGDAVTGAGG